jgi:acetoin utilization protein AcuB
MDKWTEVRLVMTRDLITAGPDDTLSSVYEKVKTHHIQHIPVVEGAKILGIISKGDLHRMEHHLTLFNAQKAVISNKQVFDTVLAKEIMVKQIVKLRDKDTVSVAVDLFRENLFHALPVVNAKDELVGIVTPLDLLKYAFDEHRHL